MKLKRIVYEVKMLDEMGNWTNDIAGCDGTASTTLIEAKEDLAHLQGQWPDVTFRIFSQVVESL